LKAIDFHFFTKPKKIKTFRSVTDGASGDINHYLKIKTKLEQAEVKLLHELIEETIEKKYKTREEIAVAFREGKIDYAQMEFEFEKFDQQKKAEENIKMPEVDRSFLMEHFYNPVLLASPTFSDLFQNVISADSELDFYRRLISFAKNANGMSKYDWWYFSKVVENVDDIKIPYYNSEKGEYSNFYPDFIFWLKQGDKYIITFIDPKGLRQGTENTRDKVLGYENIFPSGQSFQFDGKPLEVRLWLYNEQHTNDTLLNKYRRWNFDEMF